MTKTMTTLFGPSIRHGGTPATLGPAPIALSDRYGSIAEESETTAIPVPIADLVVQRPRKLRKMKTKIAKTQFAHPSNCGCCPTPVNESEITFYVHGEGMLEEDATAEVLYPYDNVCLLGSTRTHWGEDSCTTSMVGGGGSRIRRFRPVGGHGLKLRQAGSGASDPVGRHGIKLQQTRSGASDQLADTDEWDSEAELSNLSDFPGQDSSEAEEGS